AGNGDGVFVQAVQGDPPPEGIAILGNSIYNNANVGIELSGFIQAAPALTSATASSSGTSIKGTLHSTPRKTFRIEFFANAVLDAKGRAEGKHSRGAITVTTTPPGSASFTATFSTVVPAGQFITATATPRGGNTSAFSGPITVTSAGSATGSNASAGLGWTAWADQTLLLVLESEQHDNRSAR